MTIQVLEQGDSDTTNTCLELMPGVPQLMLLNILVLVKMGTPGTKTRPAIVRTTRDRRYFEWGCQRLHSRVWSYLCNARPKSWCAFLPSSYNIVSDRKIFWIDRSPLQSDTLPHLLFKTGGYRLLPADSPKGQ